MLAGGGEGLEEAMLERAVSARGWKEGQAGREGGGRERVAILESAGSGEAGERLMGWEGMEGLAERCRGYCLSGRWGVGLR